MSFRRQIEFWGMPLASYDLDPRKCWRKFIAENPTCSISMQCAVRGKFFLNGSPQKIGWILEVVLLFKAIRQVEGRRTFAQISTRSAYSQKKSGLEDR